MMWRYPRTQMEPVRARKHRLPESAYRGKKCVAITAVEIQRRPILSNDQIHNAVRDCLSSACSRFNCLVPIYCIMPDHLHVLILGEAEASEPKKAIERFKWEIGSWFVNHQNPARFQKDFYDHIVRRSEGWESQARYIALNPVRRQLVMDIVSWPYTGSIGFDLEEFLLESWWDGR